tara:strand:+ start:170813 stop:171382 length:570 start_codon:yes stop_codon:yes gene_type:complete
MSLPLTKRFEFKGQGNTPYRVDLVPMTNVMPLSEISSRKMPLLENVCFGDDIYNDIISHSNDSNIQVSVHPVTCQYYAIYHVSSNEAYVIRADKVSLREDEPVVMKRADIEDPTAAQSERSLAILRTSYIQGRDQFVNDVEDERALLASVKGDKDQEALARTRLKKAEDNLRRLNVDIEAFEQEHGELC